MESNAGIQNNSDRSQRHIKVCIGTFKILNECFQALGLGPKQKPHHMRTGWCVNTHAAKKKRTKKQKQNKTLHLQCSLDSMEIL